MIDPYRPLIQARLDESLQGKALALYPDASLSEGYGPITIKRRFAILSHFYKIAAQEEGDG
ncbi:MAG: hypothetical protein M0Z76_09065 [Gammaproteobacteria bacterium]|nr:hypothetical protein [Gammaproteobacteria bacterium]